MSPRANKLSALFAAGALVAMAGVAIAQQTSVQTTTQMGKPESTTTTRMIAGTIVSVDGNKVVVRDAKGAAKEYTVPDGFKFQMGGKDVGVADLQAGQSVSATVTTTTTETPVTVTEVRKGMVMAVAGNAVIVKGPNGMRKFTQEDIQKRHAKLYNAQGQQIELSQLREGDIFTAVIVTDAAPHVVSQRELQASVHPAPAAAPAAAPKPAPTAAPAPAPAPAPAAAPAPAPAKKKLPKTASDLPLIGFAGALSLAAGLGLTAWRRTRRA